MRILKARPQTLSSGVTQLGSLGSPGRHHNTYSCFHENGSFSVHYSLVITIYLFFYRQVAVRTVFMKHPVLEKPSAVPPPTIADSGGQGDEPPSYLFILLKFERTVSMKHPVPPLIFHILFSLLYKGRTEQQRKPKKSTSLSGRATNMEGGGKTRAIKEKVFEE